jgi:hypothetical protein
VLRRSLSRRKVNAWRDPLGWGIHTERVDILKFRKAVQDRLEFLRKRFGRVLDFAGVECSDSRNLEAGANLCGQPPLGPAQDNVQKLLGVWHGRNLFPRRLHLERCSGGRGAGRRVEGGEQRRKKSKVNAIDKKAHRNFWLPRLRSCPPPIIAYLGLALCILAGIQSFCLLCLLG